MKESRDPALKPIDKEVIGILLENHSRFRSFIARRVGSESVAEDILQLSFKKALEHPPVSADEMSVLAWFYTTLRNTLIDHFRSLSSEEKKLTELSAFQYQDQETENAICQCLTALLPTLKPEYAKVVREIDLEKRKTQEELAKELGISRNLLDVRLHRARQALKTALIRTCGACTEHSCLNCTCD